MKYCPCGSEKRYLECCGAYLEKKAVAPTPEALMRSRYSAFVEKKPDYLNKTMKLPPFNKKKIVKGEETWLGLQVIAAYPDEKDPQIGYVEFIAKFQIGQQPGEIREVSEFHLEDGKWYYIGAKSA